MRNMKTPWAILSAARPYTFILSISIHALIFSIPVSMVIKPQIHDMELFVSIEDLRIQTESVRPQMETKEPQPEPVRETSKPIETSHFKIKNLEMTEPVREVRVEPVEESKEQPIKAESRSISQRPTEEDLRVPTDLVKTQMETKEPQPEPVREISKPIEAPRLEIENLEMTEPVREVRVERAEEVMEEPAKETKEESLKVGSKSISQPAIESREPYFVPVVPNIKEGNTGVLIKDGSVGMASGVGKQPLVSHNVTGGDAGHPIDTRFGTSIAPAFLHKEMPIYPMFARNLGREGRVMLKLTIDENGNLLDIEVIEKAGYGFTEAAVEAVKKSTFLPAKRDGKPIASRALLPIRFQLKRD
jgi:TonB family protein